MKARISHLLPVLLMLLLGAMTLWLQFSIENRPAAEPAKNRHDPDAIAEKVAIARMDASGIAQYHLVAEKMVHFPDNDSMELTAPRFHKKDASAELTVSARRGTINQEVKEARFYDNVQLIRRPDAGADSLQIRTQYMQVFMDKGVARTDRAVNIVNGPSTLAGTGMEYERESGHLTLLSAVKGKFNAPKH